MKFLITGASGFVGRSFCAECIKQKIAVVLAAARENVFIESCAAFEVGNIDHSTNWRSTLLGVDVVIHLAARVHIMKDNSADPLAEFRKVNVDGTLNLAKQAIEAGVKRFIFISSVKVNGESTLVDKPFTEHDMPNPQDAYGVSKLEAEQGLKTIAQETGMEVVIIRPPLVYGEGVKANFKSLIKLAQLNIPLPFGGINNKRSLVFIDNLINFILLCTHHPSAANQTFLISDDDDVSTTQLIKYIKVASGKKDFLLLVPQSWLNFLFRLMGKASLSDRLCGNLQVDITKAKALLNWKPPYSVKEGIARTVSYQDKK